MRLAGQDMSHVTKKVPLPASRKKDLAPKKRPLPDKTERGGALMPAKRCFLMMYFTVSIVLRQTRSNIKSRIFQKSKIRAVKQPIRTYSAPFSMSGRQNLVTPSFGS